MRNERIISSQSLFVWPGGGRILMLGCYDVVMLGRSAALLLKSVQLDPLRWDWNPSKDCTAGPKPPPNGEKEPH